MVNITKKIKVTTLLTTFFYLIKLGNGLRLLFTFVLSAYWSKIVHKIVVMN